MVASPLSKCGPRRGAGSTPALGTKFMKAKTLITEKDFALNHAGVTKKLPKFNTNDGSKYSELRGHLNYGISLAVGMANRRAAPILNAVVGYFYGEDEVEREKCLSVLKEIADEYKDEEDLSAV